MSFDLTQALVDLLRRWDELTSISAAVIVLVFSVGGIIPMSRTFLTLAAGVVYGMKVIPIVIPATTLGCLVTFLLSRYLLSARVWRAVQAKPKAVAIMNAVEAEGWRIIALCRLASPLPSTIQNATFGITRIGLWPFTWATFVFTIPQIILYTYLGSIGKAALLGEPLSLGMMAASGLTLAIVVLLITRRVRASIREIEEGARS